MTSTFSKNGVIIGFDPGLAQSGYGIIRVSNSKLSHLCHGTISTFPDESEEIRLKHLHDQITEVLQKYKPNRAGIESIYFARNVRSAIPVAQARGVILLSCAEFGIPVLSFSPPQIKQSITGIGRAQKHQVQTMLKFLFGLAEEPQSDHAADALAVAWCTFQEGNQILEKQA